VEGVVGWKNSKFVFLADHSWVSDSQHQAQVCQTRYRELAMMDDFCKYKGCLMEFLARALDDPHAEKCGKCANCAGAFIPSAVNSVLAQQALQFLRRTDYVIEPRILWPSTNATQWKEYRIAESRKIEPGRVLCFYQDESWGRLVSEGKYLTNRFADELVDAAWQLISARWQPRPNLKWITAIPSRRRTELTPDFARRLAQKLGVPFQMALRKEKQTREQKEMQNSSMQVRNLNGTFAVDRSQILSGAVLLVDDMVDSRWTITYAGALLRDAGVEQVYPFALAMVMTGMRK
jgi:ATP-dependent DNA helicase RecQ